MEKRKRSGRRRWAALLLTPLVAAAAAGAQGSGAPGADPFAGRSVVLDAQELRGLPGEVAALLLRAQPGGDLTFEVNAVALPGGGDRALVPIVVEIDGAALLDRGQGVLGRVEVYAYAIDPAGKIGDFLVQAFTLDAEKLGEVLWQSGPRFQGNLHLPPGDYKLRILVRESQSKAAGLRELPLKVAPPALAEEQLGPPLFDEPRSRDSWIPVRAATPPAQGLLEESVAELEKRWQRGKDDYPLTTDGRALVPAALPVLGSDLPLRVYLPIEGLPAGAGKAEFLDGEKVVASVPLQAPGEDAVQTAAGDSSLHAFQITPPALPQGRYTLRVSFGQVVSPPRDVLLVPREARDGELLWSDLRWRLKDAVPVQAELAGGPAPKPNNAARRQPAAGPRPPSKEDAARVEAMRVQVSDVAGQYRGLIGKLPDQPRPVNVARLLEMEAKILESSHDDAMNILQTAELRVADELATWDAEALVPLIQLHYESYLAYRQRKIFALLTHSRILADRLIELYVQKGKSEGVRRMAALVLGGLGLEAEEGNLAASSRRFYQRALELDPSSRQALLGLATTEERQSHRDQALDLLRKLVETHPDFTEGLLRLGVNERYAKRDPREHLAKAQSLPGPPWIGRLAYEEMARLDLAKPAVGADLLAKSPSFSGELSTVALMAHLEDRRGRYDRSLQLARAAPVTGADSARRRYDSVPREERLGVFEELSKAAEIRRPLIAEWAAKGGKR